MRRTRRAHSRVFLAAPLLLGGALSLSAAELPRVYALTNARIVTSPGKAIDKGVLVVRRGVIEAVGESVPVPKDAQVVDLAGRTIYPGLLDPYVTLGRLAGRRETPPDDDAPRGPGAARPTPPPAAGNAHPVSAIRAEHRASADLVLNDDAREKLRSLGFALVQAVPDQGVLRGSSAIVSLGDGAPARNLVRERFAQVVAVEPEGAGFGGPYPGSKMGGVAATRQAFLDARWYREADAAWKQRPSGARPDNVEAWAALGSAASGKEPVFFETPDVLSLLRAGALSKEFGLAATYVGAGDAFRLLDEVKAARPDLVLSLAFPPTPSVDDDDDWIDVPLERLRAWDRSPSNPRWLRDAGLTFALTTHGLTDVADLPERVRRARARGLSADDVLAAFTTIPARQLGLQSVAGEIAPGRLANLAVTDGELFAEKTRVLETWVDGRRYEAPAKKPTLTGTFRLGGATLEVKADRKTGGVTVSATPAGGKAVSAANPSRHVDALRFELDGAALGWPAGTVSVTAFVDGDEIRVEAGKNVERGRREERPDRLERAEGSPEKGADASRPDSGRGEAERTPAEKPDSDVRPVPPRWAAPLAAPKAVLVRNATIWTGGPAGILENAGLLVVDGKVAAVGRNVDVPDALRKDLVEIDAAGRSVTPGLIDCHSHTAVDGSVNEGTNNVTAEVRIADVLNPFDVAIYRELAGGLTTAHVLHGSANAIGGQDAVVKLRWGAGPEGLRYDAAVPGIKFALGENPKRSNAQNVTVTRYPQTRMGVSALIRERFLAARDYRRRQKEAEAARKRGEKAAAPKPDLQLEAIAEILEGKRLIHSHAYVKQEMLDLLRLCEEFGVRIATFQHVLEGYKIADEIAKHGAGASTFTDWWAYKFEVYDAIPYNGALMHERGVTVTFNSDSNELARRLNLEAAKAVEFGGVPRDEAIKFVTGNAAKQLGIEKRTGSLETGKDGDFVIWSGDPLSSLTVCDETWVEGRKQFDRRSDLEGRRGLAAEKAALVAKARVAAARGGPTQGPDRARPSLHGCLDDEEQSLVGSWEVSR